MKNTNNTVYKDRWINKIFCASKNLWQKIATPTKTLVRIIELVAAISAIFSIIWAVSVYRDENSEKLEIINYIVNDQKARLFSKFEASYIILPQEVALLNNSKIPINLKEFIILTYGYSTQHNYSLSALQISKNRIL